MRLSKAVLRDKIRGGWAAQTIGVTFGGPTEFNYNGTFIQDYEPIPWYAGYLRETYERNPGLYDDVYVDLTFVDVIEKHGLDAPAATFGKALANAEYMLWHANQMARYNVLRGLAPPDSGHWRNNPEADDIDFQIEADFIGLMAPGLPNAATTYADKVGHIMNSGDGWYGGVFVAAMYSLAFVHDDVRTVVTRALDTIPAAQPLPSHDQRDDSPARRASRPTGSARGSNCSACTRRTSAARRACLPRSTSMPGSTPRTWCWGCCTARAT